LFISFPCEGVADAFFFYCDACVESCPVDAVFAEDQLPDEWLTYAGRNAAHYAAT
jgi:ferredoxin